MSRRTQSMAYNSFASLFQQMVSIICGLIVPKLILNSYGSSVNGMISSITQFIGFAALFQGGITGAARVAFYKPVAMNDDRQISAVYRTARSYFRKITMFVVGYIIILAFVFPLFDASVMSYTDAFLLVAVIGISSVFEYLFGIVNQLLLFADQKAYINSVLLGLCTLLSGILSYILIRLNCSIIIVKLFASAALLLRPLMLNFYVRKKYRINNLVPEDNRILSQSNASFVKSIAFYIHSSTDTMVLTLFMNMAWVSVYAVHKYVVGSISSLVSSVLSNTEAVFGQLFARNDSDDVLDEIMNYDLLTKIICNIFFIPTILLINQFVSIYTEGITDAAYHQPLFAFLFVSGEMVYCTGLTYHNIIMANGHLRQTKWISVSEACINLGLSLVLVHQFGIIGVACGTLAAFTFTSIADYFYVRRNIIKIPADFIIKEYLCSILIPVVLYGVLNYVITLNISSFTSFFISGAFIFIATVMLVFMVYFCVFNERFLRVLKKMKR